jgi:nitroreductase
MISDAHLGSRSDGPMEVLDRVLDEVLRAAVAAPSMHNTQPWRMSVRNAGCRIELYADPARMLPVADPDGRAAHIACGAALFNMRMAAAAAELRAHVQLIPEPGRPLLIAEIDLAGDYQTAPWERELYEVIFLRRTNREPYSGQQVPPGVRAELTEAAQAEDAVLHFLDGNEAARMLHLAAEAERELLADPAYCAELDRWAGASHLADGIRPDALGPRSDEGRDVVRDFAPHRHWSVRYAKFEEDPQLAVLSVRLGGAANWLAAGQALERVWLAATCRGISMCPLNQPLETAEAWLVRDPRSGSEEPQMIMRIGYGPPAAKQTPRRALGDVVERCAFR